VKLTAKVKLLSNEFQVEALQDTLRLSNECANWLSGEAWKTKRFKQFDIHRLCYKTARDQFPLSAQIVVRLISKVADSYKLDRKSKHTFRPESAIAYDDRILSWKIEKRVISIWTTAGRLRIPFVAGERQLRLLSSRLGETDLILDKGIFYLAAICEVPTPSPSDVEDFLGCDFGIVNIVTDSDGNIHSGKTLNAVRSRRCRLRAALQRKQTRSAKRKLKRLSGKDSRFTRNINHCISKQIVSLAKRTDRGIAIEDLKGIRDRIRARRKQRGVLHSWSFAQLRDFLEYKSTLAGVCLVTVDPRNTSRECSECGHTEKANRQTQARFHCRECGYTALADLNAALNIRSRAVVNRPIVADCAAA
jgi:IS605 OrfB family transposase